MVDNSIEQIRFGKEHRGERRAEVEAATKVGPCHFENLISAEIAAVRQVHRDRGGTKLANGQTVMKVNGKFVGEQSSTC